MKCSHEWKIVKSLKANVVYTTKDASNRITVAHMPNVILKRIKLSSKDVTIEGNTWKRITGSSTKVNVVGSKMSRVRMRHEMS